MKESKEPLPEQYGWISRNGLDDDKEGWVRDEGYYTALKNWDKEKLRKLFDEKGKCLKDKELYFKNGDLIDAVLIHQNCHTYPAKSDIVRMYYADLYADETHGNYTAQTLFFRAF